MKINEWSPHKSLICDKMLFARIKMWLMPTVETMFCNQSAQGYASITDEVVRQVDNFIVKKYIRQVSMPCPLETPLQLKDCLDLIKARSPPHAVKPILLSDYGVANDADKEEAPLEEIGRSKDDLKESQEVEWLEKEDCSDEDIAQRAQDLDHDDILVDTDDEF